MKPDFTDEEKFTIAFFRSKESSSTWRVIMPDVIRVWASLMFLVVSYITQDYIWIGVAFVTLLWGILGSMLHMKTMLRQYRSIFEKYDVALTSNDDDKN